MEELDQMIDEVRKIAATYVDQCEKKAEKLEKVAEYLEELKVLRNFDKAINLLQEYMDSID